MSKPLPVRLDPYRAAEQGRTIVGEVDLKGMKRLAEMLGGNEGSASCTLRFYKASKRDSRIKGSIETVLTLKCERCLSLYEFKSESEFEVALVSVEAQETAVVDDIEPYLVEEDSLEMLTFIEDEILLGLPAIPKHPDEKDCDLVVEREFDPDAGSNEPEEDKKPNPFAVLENLKKR